MKKTLIVLAVTVVALFVLVGGLLTYRLFVR